MCCLLVDEVTHESTVHGGNGGDVKDLHQIDEQFGHLPMQDVQSVSYMTDVVSRGIPILKYKRSEGRSMKLSAQSD